MSAAFDREAALDRFGGDIRLMKDLIVVFLENAPRQLAEIRESIASCDSRRLERVAHTLKGDAGMWETYGVQETAKRLETMARDGDFSETETTCTQLEVELGGLTNALREFLSDAHPVHDQK